VVRDQSGKGIKWGEYRDGGRRYNVPPTTIIDVIRYDAGRGGNGIEQMRWANAASKAWQKKKATSGWACLHWPREYGGGAYSPIELVIWSQEEGLYAALSGPFIIGHGMCGPTVMTWALEDHKQRRLPPLASGEEIWCQLFSEPAGGSDLAGLRSKAERADDDSGDWIVNGSKVWTSGAQHSAVGSVVNAY
jgi:acyl-CoA dehydrogenase